MRHIKVVWKDSIEWKDYVYRGITISSFGGGWVIDIEGNDNIYKTKNSSINAIDSILGERHRKGAPSKRLEEGIIVIGKISDYKKDNETA